MAFDAQSYHKPILAEKCIEFLNVRQGGIYVDCTAGGGGHSALILEKLSGKGKLLAFDKDDDAIRFCSEAFRGCGSVELIKSDFKNAARVPRGKRAETGRDFEGTWVFQVIR